MYKLSRYAFSEAADLEICNRDCRTQTLKICSGSTVKRYRLLVMKIK